MNRVQLLSRIARSMICGVVIAAAFAAFPARAQLAEQTVLHSFGSSDAGPEDCVIQGTDGNFYGTTSGVSGSSSTVFKITPAGDYTLLYTFGSAPNDGYGPHGLVQGADGNFYGLTGAGGTANLGTVYKITPTGQETILHSFGDGSVQNDGVNPSACLIKGSDGNFYGTTIIGGSANLGTVFKITPTGQVTILHSFGDGSVQNDGTIPWCTLVQGTDGNFYGMTGGGGPTGTGSPYGIGTVFKITPAGHETVLHSFGDGSVQNDGAAPSGGLVQGTDGNFYGTTYFGGATDDGTAFKITPDGQETILHSFGDGTVPQDGANPSAGLIQSWDGNFYGTTAAGGLYSTGTAFRITPGGQVEILYSFNDGTVNNDEYWVTIGLMQASDGNFYGLTGAGGANGDGTVFKLVLTPTFPAGLQMLSVPYSYPGVNLDTLFGYSGVTLAVYEPSALEYAITPTAPADGISVGRGYWARLPQNVILSGIGTPAPAGQNFDIPLTAGWNMVGDPFPVPVPIASLLFDGGTETFAQATSGFSPLIGAKVYGYSPPPVGQYQAATSLEPEQGYWIFAYSNTDVEIPSP
jgi:uncharacterized repeat protein (TIGR03803 family)